MSGPGATAQPLLFQNRYDVGIDSNTNEGITNYDKLIINNGSQNNWAALEDEAFEYYDNGDYYGINETQDLKQVNLNMRK